MRTGSRITLLLAVVTMTTVACSSSGDDVVVGLLDDGEVAPSSQVATSPTPHAPAASSIAPAAPAAVGDQPGPRVVEAATPVPPALDFSARRLEGGTLDGHQLTGHHVVLWMWAPWCPQCNREAPHVAAAVAAYGDRVTFVGMAGHDTDDAHRSFVAEHGLDGMVHVVDDDGSLWAHYGVSYQPAWVLIDDDGTAQVVAGGLYGDLDARLRALVDG